MGLRGGRGIGPLLVGTSVLLISGCALLSMNPVARFEVTPVVIYAGEKVTFDGASSYSGQPIISYTWEFGDGETTSGQKATHTYAEAGRYRVTLEVKDAAGSSGRVSEEIVVYLRSGSTILYEDFSSGTQALAKWALDPTWASAQEGSIENLGGEHGFVLHIHSGIDCWHRRTATVKVPPLRTGQRLAFSCQAMTTHTQDAHTFFIFPARKSLESLAGSLPYFVYASEGGGSFIREPDAHGDEVGHLLSFKPGVYLWNTYTFVFSPGEYQFLVNDVPYTAGVIPKSLLEEGEWLILLGDESYKEACNAYFDGIRMWIEE